MQPGDPGVADPRRAQDHRVRPSRPARVPAQPDHLQTRRGQAVRDLVARLRGAHRRGGRRPVLDGARFSSGHQGGRRLGEGRPGGDRGRPCRRRQRHHQRQCHPCSAQHSSVAPVSRSCGPLAGTPVGALWPPDRCAQPIRHTWTHGQMVARIARSLTKTFHLPRPRRSERSNRHP
ncbi:hypothetical protein ADK43_38950 [Streptomyces rimosus subsp. rimosus]|nr:hypothetical protein ADK43_38950 [Streptomyces rimosus subsp. rimosus]